MVYPRKMCKKRSQIPCSGDTTWLKVGRTKTYTFLLLCKSKHKMWRGYMEREYIYASYEGTALIISWLRGLEATIHDITLHIGTTSLNSVWGEYIKTCQWWLENLPEANFILFSIKNFTKMAFKLMIKFGVSLALAKFKEEMAFKRMH